MEAANALASGEPGSSVDCYECCTAFPNSVPNICAAACMAYFPP